MGELLYCSFCGKANSAVRVLIAGPTVFICDGCVEVCRDIVGWHRERALRGVIDTFADRKLASQGAEGGEPMDAGRARMVDGAEV